MLDLKSKPQTSLWINSRFVNLYAYSTLDKKSIDRVGAVAAKFFLKKSTMADLTFAKSKLMIDSLVDPEDAIVIMSLSENDVRWHFQDWILSND